MRCLGVARHDTLACFALSVILSVVEESEASDMVNIHQYWIYIMSNKTRTVLYIGVTNDLYRRYIEHKENVVEGFTKKYKCHDLLYYEEYRFAEDAIAREKQLKRWKRDKKEVLIAKINPERRNLAEELGW